MDPVPSLVNAAKRDLSECSDEDIISEVLRRNLGRAVLDRCGHSPLDRMHTGHNTCDKVYYEDSAGMEGGNAEKEPKKGPEVSSLQQLQSLLVHGGVDSRIILYMIERLQISSITDFAYMATTESYDVAMRNDIVGRVEPFSSCLSAPGSTVQVMRLRTAWAKAHVASGSTTKQQQQQQQQQQQLLPAACSNSSNGSCESREAVLPNQWYSLQQKRCLASVWWLSNPGKRRKRKT